MLNLKNNISNNLILLTSSYPYGNSETFLENEIEYLSNNFKKILILAHNLENTEARLVPKNVKVIRFRYNLNFFEKLFSISQFFSSLFWAEYFVIKKQYNKKITLGILKTMLISIFNAKRMLKFYKSQINDFSPSVPILYSYWSNDSAISLALLKSENNNIKCVSRVHGSDVFFEPSKYNYLPYRNLIANKLNAVYSIANEGLTYSKNILKIPNYSTFKLSRLGVKKQLLIYPERKFTLMSCSNVIPLKRVDLIVKALEKLPKELAMDWYHFGSGPGFEKIKQMAKERLNQQIHPHFMGLVSNQKVLKIYKEYCPNIFINVSSSEGVPVSIMEAMSFGTPVIATNVGGNSEIVNEHNGILLSFNPSVKEVADAILKFSEMEKEQYDTYRKAAYDTCNDNYNSQRNYTAFARELAS